MFHISKEKHCYVMLIRFTVYNTEVLRDTFLRPKYVEDVVKGEKDIYPTWGAFSLHFSNLQLKNAIWVSRMQSIYTT